MKIKKSRTGDEKIVIDGHSHYDVILTGKVRLSRNLDGFGFPGKMAPDDEKKVEKTIIDAVKTLPEESEFAILYMNELDADTAKWIIEKNLINLEEFSLNDKAVCLSKKDELLLVMNHNEHLCISTSSQGLSLESGFEKADKLDSLLEKSLNYACSLEWGYHSTAIEDIGTGLKLSIYLHLPALTITSYIDEVKKSFSRHDFYFRNLFFQDKKPVGNIFKVTTGISFGTNEKRLIETINDIVLSIAKLERKSRNELLENNRLELEDRVFRVYGILKYCQTISFREAIEHISYLRLGVCLGIIKNASITVLSSLIFRIQDYYVKKVINESELLDKDKNILDITRAKIIRDALSDSSPALPE